MDLTDLEKSILNQELKSRIYLFSKLKKSVIKDTHIFIDKIQELCQSLLNLISSKIKLHQDLINKKVFSKTDFESINFSFNTEMILESTNIRPSLVEFNNFYSEKNFLAYNISPEREISLNYQKFLKSNHGDFRCLAISNESDFLITGSEDTIVRVWDLKKSKQTAVLDGHKSTIRCIAISNNDKLAVTGSDDRSVIIWNLSNLKNVSTLTGFQSGVFSVGFLKNQEKIVSGSFAGEIFIWDLNTYKCIEKLFASNPIFCGTITPNDLYFCGSGNLLEAWDLINLRLIYSIQVHFLPIRSIAVSLNSNFAIIACNDNNIIIFDLIRLCQSGVLVKNNINFTSLTISADSNFIVSGSSQGIVLIWNISTMKVIKKFSKHNSIINQIIIKNDLIYSASSDSSIGIVNLQTKTFESFMNGKLFQVKSEYVKGNLISFGSSKDVIICDISNRDEKIILKGHISHVTATCISAKSTYLLSSSLGNTKNLNYWNIKDKTHIHELKGHESSVLCIDLSKDDNLAISGDSSGLIILWNLLDPNQMTNLGEHENQVNSVKISSLSKFAVSGGHDFVVNVWDLNSKCLYVKFDGHKEIIWKVLITNNDKFIVSADMVDGIKVWDYEKKELKHEFRNIEESESWIKVNKDLKFDLRRFLF